MERKTYYMVLGVSRDASPQGIQSAYRDLAKRFHPDVAGEQATRTFQELSEAYGVLSDPQRRFDYNHELRRLEEGQMALKRPEPRPEPIVHEPVAIFGDPESIHPSFEALYGRFIRNVTGIGVPKSERVETLNLEVLLTPEEASRGCVVPVGVPVFQLCPHCGGSGRDWLFPCALCMRQGVVEAEATVSVRVPPRLVSGSIFELPLEGLGIHNLYLRLHVQVGT